MDYTADNLVELESGYVSALVAQPLYQEAYQAVYDFDTLLRGGEVPLLDAAGCSSDVQEAAKASMILLTIRISSTAFPPRSATNHNAYAGEQNAPPQLQKHHAQLPQTKQRKV